MSTPTKRGNKDAECSCGVAGCKGSRALNLVVEKRHLRRAIAAANRVNDAAAEDETPEAGVVFMTALLLVERLASTFRCEPHAVLAKMADCFELKRRYTVERKDHN